MDRRHCIASRWQDWSLNYDVGFRAGSGLAAPDERLICGLTPLAAATTMSKVGGGRVGSLVTQMAAGPPLIAANPDPLAARSRVAMAGKPGAPPSPPVALLSIMAVSIGPGDGSWQRPHQ
jgi:hypothetical protein